MAACINNRNGPKEELGALEAIRDMEGSQEVDQKAYHQLRKLADAEEELERNERQL